MCYSVILADPAGWLFYFMERFLSWSKIFCSEHTVAEWDFLHEPRNILRRIFEWLFLKEQVLQSLHQ